MNKEQILELIRSQEAQMYSEVLELREAFGPDDSGTRHAAAQWNAIRNLLETIEENENN
jgi:hypothetical protein